MSAVEERRHEYQGACERCKGVTCAVVVLDYTQAYAPDTVRGFCWRCGDQVKFARQVTT